MDNEFVCCICGRTCKGYGNNPYPVCEDGECCDDCNMKVISIRIKHLERSRLNGNQRLQ